MELKEFIEQALTEIMLGVHSAQENLMKNEKLEGKYFIINPTRLQGNNFEGYKEYHERQYVEFEVYVETSEDSENNKAINVLPKYIGLGLESEKSYSNVLSNRLNFKIPIILPYEKK